MYYYIRGKYVLKGDSFVVIDAGGVGYKIYTSQRTIDKSGETGSELLLYTHYHVREDAEELFGFIDDDELSMFTNLLSVSGVGPKAALAVLSVASPSEIAKAVIEKNVKIITKAAGVGPKLAERIILELKNKIKNIDFIPEEYSQTISEDSSLEAVSALVALGYSAQEAKKAVSLCDENANVEDVVREALKKLMK